MTDVRFDPGDFHGRRSKEVGMRQQSTSSVTASRIESRISLAAAALEGGFTFQKQRVAEWVDFGGCLIIQSFTDRLLICATTRASSWCETSRM